MKCAYCKQEKPATREHIIPKGIIDLFPECELVISMRGQEEEDSVYKGEAVIKDVCSECNNIKLSELDAYGLEFIKKYFVIEYDKDISLEVEYTYHLLVRWLLKIAYNNERAYRKDENQLKWFEENIKYMLGDDKKSKFQVSVFCGVSVNTSPMPLFYTNNKQIMIFPKPILVVDGMLQRTNPCTGGIRVNKSMTDMLIEGLASKYLIQFGSGLFLILMWNEDADTEKVKVYEQLINEMFPYKLLEQEKQSIEAQRCTHAFNVILPQVVDCNRGLEIADSTNAFMPQGSDPIELNKLLKQPWDEHVSKVREKKEKDKERQKERKRTKK